MAKKAKVDKIQLAATPIQEEGVTLTPVTPFVMAETAVPEVVIEASQANNVSEAKPSEFVDESGEKIQTVDQNIPLKNKEKVQDMTFVEFRTRNGDLKTGQRSKVIAMGYGNSIVRTIS